METNIVEQDATSGQQLAPLPNEVNIELPFSKREIKTRAEFISLKIETMLRDFEREAGIKIWALRRDLDGTVNVHVQQGSEIIYSNHSL